MGMFDSFLLDRFDQVVEEQTKKFNCVLSINKIGENTELFDIQNKPYDKGKIKIITIEKGYSLNEVNYYYNIVFLGNTMVDYSICPKNYINQNKEELIKIWNNTSFALLGLIKALHISKKIKKPIKQIDIENKNCFSAEYLKNTAYNTKQEISYCLNINNKETLNSPKTLKSLIDFLDEKSKKFKVTIELDFDYFSKIRQINKKIQEQTVEELKKDFFITHLIEKNNYIGLLKNIVHSTVFNTEKFKLIKIIEKKDLNIKIYDQFLIDYLIVEQGVNKNITQALLEKQNYKNIKSLTQICTLSFYGTKNKLYKKIQNENENKKPDIFEMLKNNKEDFYKIYYLFLTEYSLWDKDKNGNSLFSILSKKYIDNNMEISKKYTQKMLNRINKEINTNFIDNIFEKNNMLIFFLYFLRKEILENKTALTKEQIKELEDWTFVEQTLYQPKQQSIITKTIQKQDRKKILDILINTSKNINLIKDYTKDKTNSFKKEIL